MKFIPHIINIKSCENQSTFTVSKLLNPDINTTFIYILQCTLPCIVYKILFNTRLLYCIPYIELLS